MKDMTQGSILKHLLLMALPIAISMLVQTLYVLIDLYFVSRLGGEAVAGVSAGSLVFFVVMGLTQMISVATLSIMARAIGARDQPRAALVFNQALILSLAFSVVTCIAGYAGMSTFMGALAADPAIKAAGMTYLCYYLPGLAIQFPAAAVGSALRAAGVTRPTMIVQIVSVLCNIVLAPVLIAGWGTHYPMGVAGAGLASSLAILISLIMLTVYFLLSETYVKVKTNLMAPRLATWGEMFRIGLPAGGEFLLMAVFSGIIYWVMRPFGPDAQAGYAIGGRVMQVMFLPAMAVSFAVPAIAGQNFGARNAGRVRETLAHALRIEIGVMLTMALLCQIRPDLMVGLFSRDPAVIAAGTTFLRITSWNFVATGIVFACSGMFQALGNTLPSLGSSALRLLTFVVPTIYMATLPHFELVWVWYASVASLAFQAAVSFLLVRRQMRLRLDGLTPMEAQA